MSQVYKCPYFGPNKTYSLTLTVDSHPTPTNYGLGAFTAVPVTNVSYLVNGVQTYSGPGYLTLNSTGFILCLDASCYYTLSSFADDELLGVECVAHRADKVSLLSGFGFGAGDFGCC